MARDLYSPRYARLRELLIEGRKSAGLTQMALAKKLGRPQSYIADLERSERRLDLIEYLSITATIGFDPVQGVVELLAIPDDSDSG